MSDDTDGTTNYLGQMAGAAMIIAARLVFADGVLARTIRHFLDGTFYDIQRRLSAPRLLATSITVWQRRAASDFSHDTLAYFYIGRGDKRGCASASAARIIVADMARDAVSELNDAVRGSAQLSKHFIAGATARNAPNY